MHFSVAVMLCDMEIQSASSPINFEVSVVYWPWLLVNSLSSINFFNMFKGLFSLIQLGQFQLYCIHVYAAFRHTEKV